MLILLEMKKDITFRVMEKEDRLEVFSVETIGNEIIYKRFYIEYNENLPEHKRCRDMLSSDDQELRHLALDIFSKITDIIPLDDASFTWA